LEKDRYTETKKLPAQPRKLLSAVYPVSQKAGFLWGETFSPTALLWKESDGGK
jgi:hypothetical protein